MDYRGLYLDSRAIFKVWKKNARTLLRHPIAYLKGFFKDFKSASPKQKLFQIGALFLTACLSLMLFNFVSYVYLFKVILGRSGETYKEIWDRFAPVEGLEKFN